MAYPSLQGHAMQGHARGLTLLVSLVRLAAVCRGVTCLSLVQYSCQRQLGVGLSEAHVMACNGTRLGQNGGCYALGRIVSNRETASHHESRLSPGMVVEIPPTRTLRVRQHPASTVGASTSRAAVAVPRRHRRPVQHSCVDAAGVVNSAPRAS